MERPLKIILAIALLLVAIQFIVSLFFVNPRLKASLEKLDDAQRHLDSALQDVQYSRSRIDSIQQNIMKFNNYLLTIQAHTQMLYKDRALQEARFKVQRDSILAEVSKLKLKLDTIPLPDLQLYDSRQK